MATLPTATHSPRLDRVRAGLARIGDFFATQRHLIAVRDGVVGALPLVLTGSLFLLIAQPPSELLQAWMRPYTPLLLVPYRMLGGAVSLYITIAAASSLARSYELDRQACSLLALAAYLIAAFVIPAPGAADIVPSLPLQRLGAGGIFGGLLIAFASVEITRFFVARRWTIRLPGGAPDVVVRSFVALLPSVVTLTLTFLVVHALQLDVLSLLERAARPFIAITGSLPAALAVVGIDSGLWLLGVHASAALASLKPLWEAMLVENMQAYLAREPVLPHIASQQFYLWFVWQGGSGGALALALLLTRAKSAQLRNVGRIGLVPALCNVNEPILFGAPVVLNPTLAVPFVLAPMASATIAYGAFAFGWVTRPFLETAWTLPAPLGAYLATGGDPRAILLQLANLALSVLLYWPFVRRYDRRLLAREQAQAALPR